MTENELIQDNIKLLVEYSTICKKNLSLDMTRGKPSSKQLDLSNDMYNVLNGDFKNREGIDVRNYNSPSGIIEARELFAQMLGTVADNIYIGNSSSLNLMYDTLMRAMVFGEIESTTPWSQRKTKKWLCPAPGYDRHFRITETLGFELITVPMTDEGPDMKKVEKLVKDPDVLGIWCVPCYSNPDGVVYSMEVCERLAKMKTAAPDFRIYWDNAYIIHDLYKVEDGVIPDMLNLCAEYGNANRVYEFTSTSKITFAGSGLSCFACNKDNMKYAMKYLNTQTICTNKINQLVHVRYLQDLKTMEKRMMQQAKILRPKFDACLNILDTELGDTNWWHWTRPKGGYFISFYAYPGTAKRIVELCNYAGVALTPAGATYPYGKDPKDSNIRIAPSLPPIGDIKKAMHVFTVCVKIATIEKITKHELVKIPENK